MGNTKERKVIIVEKNDEDPWWWLFNKGLGASFVCISLFAVLVRLAVSLHPYSGAGNFPKFGDFEAQRHWMEITIHLPVKEWYHNSTVNDMSYWGLDYPPLTAYQSYVHGIILNLALTIGAVAAIFSSRELVASALFTLALSHKQMSAYFAPAFFSHLLGRCLRRHNPFLEVSKLALVVTATFAVLARLAPFERGIYEDYVANFWCTTSVLIKWKKLFNTQSLKLLSLAATVSTFSPSMVHQIKYPSNKGFLYALINSSFSFYLFSFQVHEKSILLPLLPATLLALEDPLVFRWLTHFGLFSMFPLLCRDKLVLVYVALFLLFYLLFYAPRMKNSKKNKSSTWKSVVMTLLVLCYFVLHIVYMVMNPPKRYPFLFEAVIMLVCFSQFVWLALYTNLKQWMLHKQSSPIEKEKKHL